MATSREQQLERQLQEAQQTIETMEEWINQVKDAALTHVTVVAITKEYVLTSREGTILKVKPPKGIKLNIGDSVFVQTATSQIVEKIDVPVAGQVVTLLGRVNGDLADVVVQGDRRTVYAGKLPADAKEGDEVLLDKSGVVILSVVKKTGMINGFTQNTNVSFAQIAGLHDAKQELVDAIVLPHQHPEIFKYYNKRPPKGILLYGPPGCGKTMLAKGAATALAEVCAGKNVESGFIYIKGPEILERFVGAAEATIRRIFAQARNYAAKVGHPALIFIDEADAIFGVRGSGISSDMEKTIVPTFLAEMDGLDPSGAIVLLATNRSTSLDPAVTRDGRIDRKIRVPRPDPTAATDIFQLNLVPIPTGKAANHAQMAIDATKELFNPKRVLYKVKTKDEKVHSFTLRHIINGGMIASIVDQASSAAMHRDLKAKTRSGLTMQDLYNAIDSAQRQNLELNHADEIEEFLAIHAGGSEFASLQAA